MRSSSILAPLAFAASTLAQAVPEGIAPSTSPPSGCETTANGNFTIGTLKLAHTKRETASEAADGALVCNLNKGVLRDSYGRTGSVVANRQFQFDGPPQAGAIYTGGFSICKNGSLAIGGTTRWFQCASGGFHNLYDQSIGGQCEEIRIQVQLLNQPSASPSAASSATSPVASVASSLATISGQISTVSASAVGPTASLSRSGNATATSAPSSSASGSAGASTSRGLTPGSSSAAGASSAAPAPPAGGAASASFSAAGSSMLGLAMAVIGGAAFIL